MNLYLFAKALTILKVYNNIYSTYLVSNKTLANAAVLGEVDEMIAESSRCKHRVDYGGNIVIYERLDR